jgi:FkbM family methyltransferase
METRIRTLLRTTGFDVVRYRPTKNPLSFLTAYNIQTVIDAGANVGQFASQVREVLPTAHIHSFEPMQDCFETLNTTFAHDPHFTAHHMALGDVSQDSVLYKNDYSPSSSLLKNTDLLDTTFPFAQESIEENIVIRTLDTVLQVTNLKKNILFKLDVQGYEEKVLRGAKTMLDASSIVLIETSFYPLYQGQPLFADIYTLLHAQGFTYHGSVQQKRHPETNEPLFEDSVFIHEGRVPTTKK